MAQDEQRWHLFLDESGSFLEPKWPVACVAGLLVRDDAPRELEANLRMMIARAAPLAPAPLHTAHANQAAFWLAAWEFADETRRTVFARLQPAHAVRMPVWCAHARSTLGDRPDVRRFYEALDARRFPDYTALRDMTGALRGALPEVARGLTDVVRTFRSSFGEMLDLLAKAYTARDCHFVAAAWFVDDDPDSALDGSHYLHALSILFERVAMTLLEGPAARHRVDAHVSRLGIDHPQLATEKRLLPLRAEDVGRAAQRAGCGLSSSTGVRVVADVPAAFDANAHPGYVFADYLANALWNAMQDGDDAHSTRVQSWSRLAESLARRFREGYGPQDHDAVLRFEAPVRRARDPRELGPMVAVTGAPAEHVRAAWASPSPSPSPCASAPTRWAGEQADRWASLAWKVMS